MEYPSNRLAAGRHGSMRSVRYSQSDLDIKCVTFEPQKNLFAHTSALLGCAKTF